MSTHPLAGDFSVDVSARRVRHYRYAEERLMRVMGGWIALTPELPVKLLFGRHVWECAQHADLWGRRLSELRAPAQKGEPPNPEFVEFMDALERPVERAESVERLVGVYRVLKPHLVATYEDHLARANPVYEPPTRVILERCLIEERRHVASGAVLLERLLGADATRRRAEAWEGSLLETLARAGGVGGDTANPRVAAAESAHPAVARDLVALDSAFAPGVMGAELQTAVDAHRRALVAGDSARLAEQLVESARSPVLDECARLGPITATEVVAVAKIGAYRVIKLRLSGARRTSVLQTQWRPGPRGWHVAEAQVVSPDAGTVAES